jgi:surfeit locus 1 family protein
MKDDYSTGMSRDGAGSPSAAGKDDASSATRRRRARVAWFLVALACSALTARFGVWQLDRAHQKLAAAALIAERSQQSPLSAGELARDDEQAMGQWERRIELEGHWIPDHTVYLANRTMDGQPGFFVLTPLRLATGDAIVVQRGWVALERGDPWKAPTVATPADEVRLAGHLAPWPSHWFEVGRQPPGAIRQNLDRASFTAEAGIALRPLTVIEDATPANAADGLGRRWTPPAVNVGVNYGYAVQWFAMSAGFLVLYAWLAFFRHRQPNPADAGDGDKTAS